MAQGKYHSTYPFLFLSEVAVLLPVAGLMVKRCRGPYLRATFGVRSVLRTPCLYPVTEWSGGDDGSGVVWFRFLGGARWTDLVLTAKNLIVLNWRNDLTLRGKGQHR
jgi:hypothetical protein